MVEEPVVGNTVQTVKTSQRSGDTAIHRETVTAAQQVDPKELQIVKVNQAIWLVIHIIGIIIFLRFIFLLFGANLFGFALMIYNISELFVRPFEGIFPAPSTGGSYFDTAALLALVVWYIFGYILTRVIALFSNRVTTIQEE